MFAVSYRTGVVLGIGLLITSLANAKDYSDNFNDNSTNSNLWKAIFAGQPACAEKNNRLEISVPASSSGNPLYAGYESITKLVGDFDVKVDFNFLNWPVNAGVRAGMSFIVGSSSVSVSRINEQYYNDWGGGAWNSTGSTDLTGQMRMTRVGSTFTGYYLDTGGTWRAIGNYAFSSSDVTVRLWSWSYSNSGFGGKETKIAFDNYRASDSVPVPEPATCVVLAGAVMTMLSIKRKS